MTFDAAGTLLFPYPSVGGVYQEIMAQFGLRLEAGPLEREFQTAFKSVAETDFPEKGEEGERMYWREIVSRALRSLTTVPQDFDALFEALWSEFAKGSRWTLNEDADRVLNWFVNRGISVALLTNWDRRVLQVLADKGIQNKFTKIIISSEVGYSKPDRRLFAHAAQALGVPHANILHVGDHPIEDIAGAIDSGFQAAHLTSKPFDAPKGAFVIKRLGDLLRDLSDS